MMHANHHRHGVEPQSSRNQHGSGPFGPHSSHGNHVMGTVTVDGRGQLVIPREARDALNIQAGDRFVVFGNEHRKSLHLVNADYFDNFADMLMFRSSQLEKLAHNFRDMSKNEDFWTADPVEEVERSDEDMDVDVAATTDDTSPSTPDADKPKE